MRSKITSTFHLYCASRSVVVPKVAVSGASETFGWVITVIVQWCCYVMWVDVLRNTWYSDGVFILWGPCPCCNHAASVVCPIMSLPYYSQLLIPPTQVVTAKIIIFNAPQWVRWELMHSFLLIPSGYGDPGPCGRGEGFIVLAVRGYFKEWRHSFGSQRSPVACDTGTPPQGTQVSST